MTVEPADPAALVYVDGVQAVCATQLKHGSRLVSVLVRNSHSSLHYAGLIAQRFSTGGCLLTCNSTCTRLLSNMRSYLCIILRFSFLTYVVYCCAHVYVSCCVMY
jgi:hypothetical protein